MQEKNLLKNVKCKDITLAKDRQPHNKLCLGNSLNQTYTVFFDDKKYFLRVRPVEDSIKRGIHDIISSKIGRIINPKCFASDKWTSDGCVVSQSVPDGFIPHPCVILGRSTLSFKEHQEYAEQLFELTYKFPIGLGFIDEVCRLLQESDENLENLMFHFPDRDNRTTRMIKIDFDRCHLHQGKSFEVKDLDEKYYGGLKSIFGNVDAKPEYTQERAMARLKFSLFSDKFLWAMLEAHCPKEFQEDYYKLLIRLREVSTQGLLSEKYGVDFIKNLNGSIETCLFELKNYTKKHDPQDSFIVDDLKDRKTMIVEFLSQKGKYFDDIYYEIEEELNVPSKIYGYCSIL